MNTITRLIINFLLAAIVVLIFRNISWLKFTNPPTFIEDEFFNDMIIAGIIGFVIFIIGEIANLGFKFIIVATCGLGCLLYPFFALISGYIKLFGTQYILTDCFTFDANLLKVSVISFAIGIARVPNIKGKKTVVVRERREE